MKYHCTADPCLFCLDSAALITLNQYQLCLFGQIQTGQTGGQLYCDTPPYGECSLSYLLPNLLSSTQKMQSSFSFPVPFVGSIVWLDEMLFPSKEISLYITRLSLQKLSRHGALQQLEMKAVSVQAESYGVYVKPKTICSTCIVQFHSCFL